jgi:hypothetical protein
MKKSITEYLIVRNECRIVKRGNGDELLDSEVIVTTG